MPRTRTIPRQASTPDLDGLVAEYLAHRSASERFGWLESRLKAQLKEILDAQGRAEGDTKKVLDLEEPLPYTQTKNGRAIRKNITGIELVTRTMTPLNPERAMELVAAKGLLEECTETVVMVNEDAILAANFDGRISDEELKTLYDETSNVAFFLCEGGE